MDQPTHPTLDGPDQPTRPLPRTTRPLEDLRPGDPAQVDGHQLLGRVSGHHLSDVFVTQFGMRSTLTVIKLASTSQSADQERFTREAKYLGRVNSIRIARVLGSGFWQDRPYLVQEFVDGPTLADVLRDNGSAPCSIGDSYRLGRGLAEALRDVHAAGVVHRDIKPANIILSDARGVTLVDFGIALAPVDPRITQQGTTLGTPRYMSPEQAAGGEIGEASDVFGWGLVVGEALLGRHPIVGMGEDWAAALHRCRIDPSLDGALGRLVHDALSRDPQQRPTLAQILAELDRTEQLEAPSGTQVIPLPARRLQDVRSWSDLTRLAGPWADEALLALSDRTGVFVGAAIAAGILGWLIGFLLGVAAGAP